jgi:hypothetical protein
MRGSQPLHWTRTSQVLQLSGGKVAKVSSAICPPLVGASVVVVREPTEAQVLLSWSQESVIMTCWISYATCHGKVVKSFKAKPPELAALKLGSTVCSCRRALLAVMGRGGTISPKLLVPHCRLPSKKVSRWRLVRPFVFPTSLARRHFLSCFYWSVLRGARRIPTVYLGQGGRGSS